MRLRFKATHVVLAMLCVMYFITYVDRVNIGTAAGEIQKELGLSNTELGLVFSAFAYPYLLFQVIGGWVGDRFGPRQTLFWCGMIWAAATIMTGFVHGLVALFVARFALGFGVVRIVLRVQGTEVRCVHGNAPYRTDSSATNKGGGRCGLENRHVPDRRIRRSPRTARHGTRTDCQPAPHKR